MKCTFPNCNNNVNIAGRDNSLDRRAERGICDGCFDKVVQYETVLDEWLSREHPLVDLPDVIGWYTKCIRSTCKRDCLEPNDLCDCCPHYLVMQYQRFKIDHFLMPTREFIQSLRLQ